MSLISNYHRSPALNHLSSRLQDIERLLRSYLITDSYLSYEYSGKNRDFIFITGYNENEKDLPPFDHPILLDGLSNNKYIVVDLRKYVKSVTEKPNSLKEILTNVSYGKFQINRAIMLDMMLSEDSYKLAIIQESIASIFSVLITNNINMMVRLNPLERIQVEAVNYIYVLRLFNSEFNNDEFKEYAKTMLRKAKLSFPISADLLNDVLTINLNAKTFIEVFENIKYILKDKSTGLQLKTFYNTIANLWYGPGALETVLLALDDLSTMVILFLIAYDDNSFKKSKISFVIDNIKRKLDKDAMKKVSLRLKEYEV